MTTTQTSTARRLDQALCLAAEYARTPVIDSGRRGQIRRTIDDLVGYRMRDGRWHLPACVRTAMGLSS